MKTYSIAILILLANLLPITHVLNTPDTLKQLEAQQEAQRIWEQYITAVGGRERLYAVRNMLISKRGEYRTGPFTTGSSYMESLYVFPNKLWVWNDMRPSKFGLSVTMYNRDSHMQYSVVPGATSAPTPSTAEPSESLLSGVILYLPESKWLKPVLIKAVQEKIGLLSVDIVQTEVEGKRVDFALDRKTHLPVKITLYSIYKGATSKTVIDLSDYTEVSGIKVPWKIKYKNGPEYKMSFEFNVEYNEDIFVHPTRIEDGPEAWRPKTKR